MSVFAKSASEIKRDIAEGVAAYNREVQKEMDRLACRTSGVNATWWTVNEGKSAERTAHPFRGSGPMIELRRSSAGVWELPVGS